MQCRFETKYDLLRQCYQDTEIKRSGKALMQYLVYISNKQHCVPAVDTIAAALSVSRRTVQRHMRTLEQRGYIVRKSRYYNHEQLSNQYVFNFGVTTETAKSDRPYPANQGEPVRKVDMIRSVMDKGSKMHVTEKVCYIYLTHICNKAGYVRKSIQDIAKAASISVLYAKAIIYRLIRKGLLKGASVLQIGKDFVLRARIGKLEDGRSGQIGQSKESQTEENGQVLYISYCASDIYNAVRAYEHKEQFDDAVCQSTEEKMPGSTAHGRDHFCWDRVANWVKKQAKCLKTKLLKLFHMLC